MGPLAELAGERSSASARVPESATVAPWRMQRAGDRAADAAGGAGHQGGLAGKIEHAWSPYPHPKQELSRHRQRASRMRGLGKGLHQLLSRRPPRDELSVHEGFKFTDFS